VHVQTSRAENSRPVARPQENFPRLGPRLTEILVWGRRLAQAKLSSTTLRATHLSARLSRRFNDLCINLFTSGQPSATVMGRPSSFLD